MPLIPQLSPLIVALSTFSSSGEGGEEEGDRVVPLLSQFRFLDV